MLRFYSGIGARATPPEMLSLMTRAAFALLKRGYVLRSGHAIGADSAFERGETTDIATVMLAKQKASVSFEATLQVRNKLLSAYRDIMNMPV